MANDWNSSTVLIISDDADFSRSLSTRLQTQRGCPTSILMGADLCAGFADASFDAAVIGPVPNEAVCPLLVALESLHKPVILLSDTGKQAPDPKPSERDVILVPRTEGYVDILVLLLWQALRTEEALERARKAEQSEAAQSSQAALGRYMLEMRHTVNNSLTSLLGNSELMLGEPGTLSASTRAQVVTIRSMALRIHEVFQRFSSLQKELAAVDQPGDDPQSHPGSLARRV
jgi:signal transduction histidine kinase